MTIKTGSAALFAIGVGAAVLFCAEQSHYQEQRHKEAVKADCAKFSIGAVKLLKTMPINPVTGRYNEFIEAVKDGAFKHIRIPPAELAALALLDDSREKWQADNTFASAEQLVYNACTVQKGVHNE